MKERLKAGLSSTNNSDRYLRWACFFIFLGKGLLIYLFGYPSRTLLWHEGFFRPIVELFGANWNWWVSSEAVEAAIVRADLLISLCWIMGAIALVAERFLPRRLIKSLVFIGGLLLIFELLLNAKENFWRVGYIIEHAAQVGTPFLLLYVWKQAKAAALIRWLSLLVALTFIGHGLYAMAVHPLPPHFILMLTESLGFIFGTGEVAGDSTVSWARTLLWVVGVLDVLAAILLLLPQAKIKRFALGWIIPWAILTTLARLVAGSQFGSWSNYFGYWMPEFLIRIAHVALPLLLLSLLSTYKTERQKTH